MAKKSNNSGGDLLGAIAFVAVLLMGLGIAIGVALNWTGNATIMSIGNWLKNIAILLGLLVAIFYSYRAARTKTRVWFVLWIVAVVLIIVFYVIGISLF